MELVWKVCTTVENCRLKRSVSLHDALHGFRAGRGTGTVILEEKVVQQLAGISHEPLVEVFLDVCKAYNSLDRGRCMDIMRGYRMGQNMSRLIAHHWENQQFVPKVRRFLGKAFGTRRGVTQGDYVSPMIFNIVVDAVMRVVLVVVCGTHEVQHSMGWAEGEQDRVFYANDRRISGGDKIWVKDALMVTVEMLRRVGPDTNMENTKSLVCTPGYIWGNYRKYTYKLRETGEVVTFS